MRAKPKHILTGRCAFLTVLILVLAALDGRADTKILNIRHWTAPDHTRIVLDVDGIPDYKVKENENRLTLNIKKTVLSQAIPEEMILKKPGIQKIVFEQTDAENCQVIFFLDAHQKVDVFKLKKFQDKPDRIVLDIYLQEMPSQPATPLPVSKGRKKKIVIVVDPGHGGEDPGAIGTKGTYEKDIVLQISRQIREEINGIPGFQAVLTRDGDYYVSFNKRLKKARDLNASLFLSIHADAARNRTAKGSSVYCLSTGAASSEAARILANHENLSDVLGGVPENETNNESNPILVDMFQTNTINLSKLYAEVLIKHLKDISCVKYEIVQEAPFRVLKLPDIPAVLIETAYLSNPREEKLLKKKDFQKKIAQAVAASAKDYFSSVLKNQEKDQTPTTIYTVQKGDTLLRIAKHFHADVKEIADLNEMEEQDRLFIGQKIIVPSAETALAEVKKEKPAADAGKSKPLTRPYRVKKGDTLASIARCFNTSADKLREINNIQRREKLFIGRKIAVPADESQTVAESDKSKKISGRKNKKAPGYYTVQRGDTLSSIAQKHSTTVAALLKINHLKATGKLLCGQKIKIP